MLGDDVLPASMWQRLVSAAQDRTGDVPTSPSSPAAIPPPSAQRPRASPPLSTKRAAASAAEAASPTSKRLRHSAAARTEPPSSLQLNVSQPSELAATPQLTAPAVPSQPIVTSVTNHNRRAERERTKKQEDSRVRIQRAAGLVAPPPQAPGRERKAYTSVEPEDAAHVSWIFKQAVEGDDAEGTAVDLFNSVATPYAVAMPMLHKARSIGDVSIWDSAAAFFRQWRTQGTPFGHNVAEATHRPPTSSRNGALPRSPAAAGAPTALSATTAGALAAAWTLCDRYEQELDVIHIRYRWAMAFLGKVYMDKVQEIGCQEGTAAANRVEKNKKKRKRSRGGQGKVATEAINTIMSAVSPSPSQQQRQQFRRRLYRALSWYKIAGELGWGMLCLMPHEDISNSWIENDLRASHTPIWCELVTRVNPAACAASRALEEWLGSEGLAGGSICDKETLYIEDIAPSRKRLGTSSQVTEVGDSEDDEDRDDLARSEEAREKVTANAAKPQRQRTLLELFQPQSSVSCALEPDK